MPKRIQIERLPGTCRSKCAQTRFRSETSRFRGGLADRDRKRGARETRDFVKSSAAIRRIGNNESGINGNMPLQFRSHGFPPSAGFERRAGNPRRIDPAGRRNGERPRIAPACRASRDAARTGCRRCARRAAPPSYPAASDCFASGGPSARGNAARRISRTGARCPHRPRH